MKMILFILLPILFFLFCVWGLQPETKPKQQQPKLLHRVYWKSSLTGLGGHGQPMSENAATEWARRGNRTFPELKHWTEAEVQK